MWKIVPLAAIAGWIASGDWLAGLSLGALALPWVLLQADEGPPVLALACTMQWVSCSIGFFYFLITGRPLDATIYSDYRTMVMLGLGCVVAMTVGLWLGRMLIERTLRPVQGIRPAYALSFKTLVLVYIVGTASLGAIMKLAGEYDGLAQAIFAMSYLRYGLLYLIFRRLVARGEWYYVAAVLVVEVVLGISGFYAGFREPLIMAVLAFLEFFDRKKAMHWATIGALGAVMATLGIVWIGVRTDYRARWLEDSRFSENRGARVELLREAVNAWANQSTEDLMLNVDRFIDRMWTIYYPALAVERVPAVLPHTGGDLMAATLKFVFEPRIFFPDKPYIKSDSEMVRKYSGVMVAGEDQNTDIAFGYAAESYIDFGVPGMFVPSFLWAFFIGVACTVVFKEYRHRDLAISIVTVIGWLSLYLFERSWTKTIGLGGTMLIYAGGLCYLLDRLWFEKFRTFYDAGGSFEDEENLAVVAGPESAPAIQLQPQQSHSK